MTTFFNHRTIFSALFYDQQLKKKRTIDNHMNKSVTIVSKTIPQTGQYLFYLSLYDIYPFMTIDLQCFKQI